MLSIAVARGLTLLFFFLAFAQPLLFTLLTVAQFLLDLLGLIKTVNV